MSALKVGDRVHVEFDATVRSYNLESVNVEREDGICHVNLRRTFLTKLVDPEPEWALDDMILVGGEVFLRRRNNSHWCGYDYNANTQVCHEAAWISRCWDQGDIQRLGVTP